LGTARRCALPVRRRRWRAVSPDKATTRQRATPSSEFVSAAARIIVPLAGASSPRPPPYMRARRERPRPAPHADADHGRLVWSQRLHGAEGSVPEPSQSRASSFVDSRCLCWLATAPWPPLPRPAYGRTASPANVSWKQSVEMNLRNSQQASVRGVVNIVVFSQFHKIFVHLSTWWWSHSSSRTIYSNVTPGGRTLCYQLFIISAPIQNLRALWISSSGLQRRIGLFRFRVYKAFIHIKGTRLEPIWASTLTVWIFFLYTITCY
jgi:hypothetical protein